MVKIIWENVLPSLFCYHGMKLSVAVGGECGIIVVAVAFLLVYLSNSKTALGLALICPFIAVRTLIARKLTRISLAIILLSIPLCFALLSSVSNFNFERISYMLYGVFLSAVSFYFYLRWHTVSLYDLCLCRGVGLSLVEQICERGSSRSRHVFLL